MGTRSKGSCGRSHRANKQGVNINYHAHIDMKTAQGYIVPWLASQADMLDYDWELAA